MCKKKHIYLISIHPPRWVSQLLSGDLKKNKKKTCSDFSMEREVMHHLFKKLRLSLFQRIGNLMDFFYVYCFLFGFHCQLVKICLCNKIPTMENLLSVWKVIKVSRFVTLRCAITCYTCAKKQMLSIKELYLS